MRNLLKDTQPGSSRVGIQTQVSVLHAFAFPEKPRQRRASGLGITLCNSAPARSRGASAFLLAPSLPSPTAHLSPLGYICFTKAGDGIFWTWLSCGEHLGGCHLPCRWMARKVRGSGMGQSHWEFLHVPHTSETGCPWPSPHFPLDHGKYTGDGSLVDNNCPFSSQCGSGEPGSAREAKRENFPAVGGPDVVLTNVCLLQGMPHAVHYRGKKKSSGVTTQF